MNRIVKSLVILAVIAVVVASASVVFAQSSTPQGTPPENGYTPGRGGQNMFGGTMGGKWTGTQDGVLHDAILAAFAEALDLSVEDLEARLSEGETMAEIALSTGLTLEDFKTLMLDVRAQVLDQAVADGTLTQEQADWMKTRGAGRGNVAGPPGNNTPGGGKRRGGRGMFGTDECPYGETDQ